MPQLSKSTQTSLSEINMVPFVDVVLVLLIIFMITAPILQSGIEVDVPKTKTVKEINQDRLVVIGEGDALRLVDSDDQPILIDFLHCLSLGYIDFDAGIEYRRGNHVDNQEDEN